MILVSQRMSRCKAFYHDLENFQTWGIQVSANLMVETRNNTVYLYRGPGLPNSIYGLKFAHGVFFYGNFLLQNLFIWV